MIGFLSFLAILLSTASIFFLFGFIYFIFNKNFWIAFISAIFYSTSANYLGYADSLANMPIDDFLKYAILFLSLYSYKSTLPNIKNKLKYLIWSLFLFSLLVPMIQLFVFFWLVALDFINAKKLVLDLLIWDPLRFSLFFCRLFKTLGILELKICIWISGVHFFRSTQAPVAISNYPLFFKNIAASLSTIGYFLDARTRFVLPIALIIVLIYKFKLFKLEQWKYTGALVVSGVYIQCSCLSRNFRISRQTNGGISPNAYCRSDLWDID